MAGRVRDAIGAVPDIEHTAPLDGPLVIVIGNLHGDEVTGLFVAHEIDRWLPDALLRGRVLLYPTVNPLGLAHRVRTVGLEGGDLNRAFPGDRNGGVAERLAAALWADVIERRPSMVIDLHADSAQAVPYALVDREINGRLDLAASVDRAASASGLTVVADYPEDEYRRYNLDRSLTGALVNRAAIPAVTLEVGPRRHADPRAIAIAADAVRGILASLGMVDRPVPSRADADGPWRRSTAWRAGHDGILVPVVPAGVRFEAGDVVAEVRTIEGALSQRIRADRRGFALSWPDAVWVTAGSPVGTFAVVDTPEGK